MSTPQPADLGLSNPPCPLIFVVDDEPLVATVVEMALQMHHYRTKLFTDPATALESFRNSDPKPDLLITDFNMPGMTGLELIQHCKAIHSQLRTILCSGTVDKEFLTSLVPQPDRLIPKPFSTDLVLNAVKALLPG